MKWNKEKQAIKRQITALLLDTDAQPQQVFAMLRRVDTSLKYRQRRPRNFAA